VELAQRGTVVQREIAGIPLVAGQAPGGMSIATQNAVLSSKQLLRDALVGFVLGLVVMSGVALVTWQTRTPPAVTH
jgi:hypothetical protein